jgi:membrane fusion protein (multidrug efflux system)
MRTTGTLPILATLAATLTIAIGCTRKPVPALPPPEVLVTEVKQQDIPIHSEWTGVLDGFVNAVIRAQVQGYLMRQEYREGSKVKKGDLLFEIDPRPFQAALDQALAQLGKTELDVKRLTPLAKEEAVSREELDDAIQANLAAKAVVESARLNLEFTRITSPVDGIAGIAAAQIGDLVGPATGPLTTVSTVDPIKVYFQISEQEYLNSPASFANPADPNDDSAPRPLELILADGSVFPQKGRLFFANRQVDAQTGTLQVAALFPNPGDVLRPGQFARVRAVTRTAAAASLVPQRAVRELQGKYQVVVIGPDDKASIRDVAVGERSGTMWIIEKGLTPGERVVVEGVQKTREGLTVTPKPYEPPAPAASKP